MMLDIPCQSSTSTAAIEYLHTETEKSRSYSVPIFHQSNSVSTPVSRSCNKNEDAILSQNYSCRATNYSNYGSIDQNCIPSKGVVQNSSDDDPSGSESGSSPQEEEEATNKRLCFGFTKRQLKVFISLVLLSLNDLMGYSAIAPFFPVVAEEKGLSAVHVGVIFASYSISGIFASVIIGTVLVKVGAKFCVMAGMFLTTGTLFCFGFLDKTGTTPFLVLCLLSRALMGVGSNTSFTAMFAIVFQEFSERAITVLSLSEALVGVGSMVAPLIGGVLYDVGGYITPFMVLGSVQAILLITCYYMLPSVPVESQIASRSPLYLLTHSSALISTLVVVVIFACNAYITANLSPFLKQEFQMNAVMVGVIFLAGSVFYAGMSPLWGYLSDKWKDSYMIEICTIGVSIGLSLVGPATCLRTLFGWTSQHKWLVFVGTVISGSFFGGAIMPTFNEMLLAAKELKVSDSVLAQYGLVSGLFNTAFSVGDIIGPTAGGVLVELFGFPDATAVLGLVCFSLSIMKLLQRFYRHRTRKSLITLEDEEEPLLSNHHQAAINA